MRALVWFRSDLRIADNPALHHAGLAADRGVVGVFAICARQWLAHDWGHNRVEFLLRSLTDLACRLERRKIPLLIVKRPRFDELPVALLTLARRHRCDALYFNCEYEVNERCRDEAVTRAFEAAGLTVHASDDQVIVTPGVLRTKAGGCHKVFTVFKRAWCEQVEANGDLEPLPAPQPRPEFVCPSDAIPATVAGFDTSRNNSRTWPAGAARAARLLTAFIEQRVCEYRDDRDFPAIDGTSCLSPYLAVGAISPRQCLHTAREANDGRLDLHRPGPGTWISELIWREFYRHVLVGYPRVSMHRAFKPETERIPWRNDQDEFNAWCEGRTGVPIVDAGMRQLANTGWMHNRLRMIVAMFLTKDLLIDWRWGERHFMRKLVDGDLASNNGGWQWAASTGTDAVPYFRIFNPYTQAQRFDPDGVFIRRYVPELRDVDTRALHNPKRFTAAERARCDYPTPICDHQAARQRALGAFK